MSRPWPDSIWAAITPTGEAFTPLDGPTTCDVAIIGAGFTGLSAALALAEAGVDVAVIEAVQPGWGASGRNNGQVIPTLTRPDPDDIVARHGEAGERFVALLRDSAQTTFDLIARHGLDAEAEQTGWIQPVHSPGRMAIAERRFEQWSRYGAPVALLSRDAMAAATGSEFWYGGWGNPTGGHINPLALTRSMAHRARALGARIFVETPAETMTHDGRVWRIETRRGTVTAAGLLLATNAYTGEIAAGLAPRIAREVVPVLSWQMATTTIGDNTRATILPGRQAMSDTHGDLHFARYDARNRLVTGGALIVPIRGARRLRTRIARRLQRMFPTIGDIGFDHVWNGYIGMTTDYMPRLHALGPNGFAWVGCNGRGVALSVALGREFARALTGAPVSDLALPLSEPRPLPAHAVLRAVAPLKLMDVRWRDEREI